MKNSKRHSLFRPGDLLLAVLLLVSVWLGAMKMSDPEGQADSVIVSIDGDERYRLELGKDQRIEWEAKNGHFVIDIQKGTVSVRESHCLGQICVSSGLIRQAGSVIACVPQKILIIIPRKKNYAPPSVNTG